MSVWFWEYARNHWIIYFKRVNVKICEWNLNLKMIKYVSRYKNTLYLYVYKYIQKYTVVMPLPFAPFPNPKEILTTCVTMFILCVSVLPGPPPDTPGWKTWAEGARKAIKEQDVYGPIWCHWRQKHFLVHFITEKERDFRRTTKLVGKALKILYLFLLSFYIHQTTFPRVLTPRREHILPLERNHLHWKSSICLSV